MFLSTKLSVELLLFSPFVWVFVHLRTFLATRRFSLISEFWVILFKFVEELVRLALSLNSLTCLFDCSKALQILIALSSVKLSSLRSNSWSFPITVKTILSLNIRSFFSRKLHAAAIVFSSVRNLPNGSWYGMVQNLWDLMTSLSRGLQHTSNASKTLSGLSLSLSSVKIKVSYTSRTWGPAQFKMIAHCILSTLSFQLPLPPFEVLGHISRFHIWLGRKSILSGFCSRHFINYIPRLLPRWFVKLENMEHDKDRTQQH